MRSPESPPQEAESTRRILRPGHNCCAVRTARRAAVLIDAADYFAALEAVFRRARRSITIIGWDFDAGTRLRPDRDDPPLGAFLRSLAEERPELEIRILVWNLSTIHAPGAALPLILGADWHDHPRIQMWLDHNHPIYGAQHQKLVSVDDSIAFVGGIDLTIDRWDTREHLPENARRTQPDGTVHGPVHDLQMAVEGEAAQAVASVIHHRWQQATGEALTPCAENRDLWPPDLRPDFIDAPIAVARTIPASGGDPEIREIKALVEDALQAAERSIYIEAQYFADHRIADMLQTSLAKETGPEIVAVIAHSAHGLLEKMVMGANRDRMIRRLNRADRHHRFHAAYPMIEGPDGPCEIFVHSKLLIVDDRFMRIGSANLNRRSSGLDTECDLSIEAQDAPARERIALVRASLLAEHLGVTADVVDASVQKHGSLIGAIKALSGNRRTLHPFDDIKEEGPVRPMLGTRLLDPDKPFPLMSLFPRRRARRRIQRR